MNKISDKDEIIKLNNQEIKDRRWSFFRIDLAKSEDLRESI